MSSSLLGRLAPPFLCYKHIPSSNSTVYIRTMEIPPCKLQLLARTPSTNLKKVCISPFSPVHLVWPCLSVQPAKGHMNMSYHNSEHYTYSGSLCTATAVGGGGGGLGLLGELLE